MKVIHSIPIGGEEPMHVADMSCWCNPTRMTLGTICHNSEDGREIQERQGRVDPGKKWVIVGQIEYEPKVMEFTD